MLKLEPLQEKALRLFAQSPLAKKFYWTGGTALAFIYLNHRKSEDIDLFSEKPFTYREVALFVHSLKKALGLSKITERKIYDRWDFLLENKDNLRIEFVQYEFPKLKPRKKWQGIMVDSLDDMAANKTLCFFERNDPKDLVDLYFLMTKKNYKTEQLLKLAKKKFGLSVCQSGFFSESMKTIKSIYTIKKMLLAGTSQEKEELIKKIEEYFTNQGASLLDRLLKETSS